MTGVCDGASSRNGITTGFTLCALLMVACCQLPATQVHVQAGSDLQALIDAAAPGSTITLAPGRHRGPLVISSALTLQGLPGASLVGTQQGSVIRVAAHGVTVRRLQVSGSGWKLADEDAGVLVTGDGVRISRLDLHDNLHGIYIKGAADAVIAHNTITGLADRTRSAIAAHARPLHVDDGVHHNPPSVQALMGNGIHLWNADRAKLQHNRIRDVRDGIYVSHSHHARFHANRISDTRYGIHYMYSSDNTISDNILSHNVAGAALMFSQKLQVTGNSMREHSGFRAYGLLLQNVDASQFRDNVMRGNRVGLCLQHSNTNVFSRNLLLGNVTGLTLNTSSRDNTFTRNRIGPNMRTLSLSGVPPRTHWSRDGVGNWWHAAMVMDLTGDGVSEWPHHEVDLMSGQRQDFPYAQLLTGSPGIQAVEWALSRAPPPGLRSITDPKPMLRAP